MPCVSQDGWHSAVSGLLPICNAGCETDGIHSHPSPFRPSPAPLRRSGWPVETLGLRQADVVDGPLSFTPLQCHAVSAALVRGSRRCGTSQWVCVEKEVGVEKKKRGLDMHLGRRAAGSDPVCTLYTMHYTVHAVFHRQ